MTNLDRPIKKFTCPRWKVILSGAITLLFYLTVFYAYLAVFGKLIELFPETIVSPRISIVGGGGRDGNFTFWLLSFGLILLPICISKMLKKHFGESFGGLVTGVRFIDELGGEMSKGQDWLMFLHIFVALAVPFGVFLFLYNILHNIYLDPIGFYTLVISVLGALYIMFFRADATGRMPVHYRHKVVPIRKKDIEKYKAEVSKR